MQIHGRRRWQRHTALAAAIALSATACLGGGDDDASSSGDDGGGGGGGTVEIFGAFSGQEEEAFNASLDDFREESGIDVDYVASSDFTTLINSRVQGGDPPDIALFPQPGLLLSFADDAVALNEAIDIGALEETLIPGFLEAATAEDGNIYGAPMRMAVKSVVWYPIPEFEEAGYTVPESFEELLDLQQQMIDDGNTPWCIGIESGADTGWVATDWMEEMMLRLHGPDVYDQWVANEIPFDAPEVVEAGEAFGEIVFTEGAVLGGAQGTISIPFGDAITPMFDDPPGCFMHRQGNFITGFMPDDVLGDLASNVGIFTLPGYESGGFDGTPLLGGGDLAAMFSDDENTAAVMEFLASDEFGGPWAEAGGWLSPHATFDPGSYSAEIDTQLAELASDADVFRFDGSDLMPGEVGAGSFWSEMVAWLNGDKDIEQALADIEATWPE